MYFIEADSMDEIQSGVLKLILQRGIKVQPRGHSVTELTSFMFRLKNPRKRIIYNPYRKFSVSFAIGELSWYLRGSNECKIISYYNKRYPDFSDDGLILYGAYGKRLFANDLTGINQWEAVKQKLITDPDTRQAVVSIFMPRDLTTDSKDIPCTCYLQFFIRDGRLKCVANMRSNDIIWGTAYDVFNFTMLQEIMAVELGLELGDYTHFAGSMHLYDRHLEMAQQIIRGKVDFTEEMPPMPPYPWKGIQEMLECEESLRCGKKPKSWPEEEYWSQLAFILSCYGSVKRNDIVTYESVKDKLIKNYSELLDWNARRVKA